MIPEEEFFKIWKDTCSKKEELLKTWNKNYTNVILGRNNPVSIMNQIKEELNKKGGQKSDEETNDEWNIHQEYYSSDVVFYKKYNMLEENPFSEIKCKWGKSPSGFSGVYLKHIDIHLEHENNIKKSWKK